MTDKLNGIKPGDRVRLEVEAEYIGPMIGYDIARFVVPGAVHELRICYKEVENPTFQITRIEPELAVGDMVTWGTGVTVYEIVAIRDDMAVLYGDGIGRAMPLNLLTRVPAK